jgi:D-alanyl-D-alanine carboxypeptidase
VLGSIRALGVSLALGAALLALPAASPQPAIALGPLPECRLDDFLTVPRDYDDWSTTLVDWLLGVGKDYVPPDLANVRNAGLAGSGLIRRVAMADLRAMSDAAKNNGTPIGSWSAYRSYRTQGKLYNDGVRAYGKKVASLYWARPGHSEHQLGLAIDFMTAGGGSPLVGDWATTRAGRWMLKHAWEYGWVLSYPKGQTGLTCYGYEPWHYRYLGREVAAAVHESGLTIREYLWTHYTTVDPTTGEPLATATAAPTSPAIPSGSPSASASQPIASASQPSATPQPSEPPVGTQPPATPAGMWFGLDPPVAVAVVVLALASIGLIAAVGLRRRALRGRRL